MTLCFFSNCKKEGCPRDELNGLHVCDSCFHNDKFFMTQYSVGESPSWFTSVFRCSPKDVNEVISQRNIGECSYRDWKGKAVPSVTRKGVGYRMFEKLSDRLESRELQPEAEDIHASCYFGYIALQSGSATPEDLLGDKGIIHELVHNMLYPGDPAVSEIKELIKKVKSIEDKIPGGVFL